MRNISISIHNDIHIEKDSSYTCEPKQTPTYTFFLDLHRLCKSIHIGEDSSYTCAPKQIPTYTFFLDAYIIKWDRYHDWHTIIVTSISTSSLLSYHGIFFISMSHNSAWCHVSFCTNLHRSIYNIILSLIFILFPFHVSLKHTSIHILT